MLNADTKIELLDKYVAEITGKFFVASYQRGYRWGELEVRRLLDDLFSNGDKPYCLQPIVVRRNRDRFELIDGQQRLTTLYLIYAYMHRSSQMPKPAFSLSYETRTSSADYLVEMDFSREIDEIDYWFMKNAYNTIEKWFSELPENQRAAEKTNINKYLTENVKVIWYETDEPDPVKLFTRLNIGKIPLTNAELVKAMFLSFGTDGIMTNEKQDEIALQWDSIERELQDRFMWYFLTNREEDTSQTHIDLVLDLIAGSDPSFPDSYHTFFIFDGMRQKKDLTEIWVDIRHTFLTLKSWYEDHSLYHKIGYLIAIGSTLKDLFALSKNKTKRQFHEDLDRRIKESISAGKDKSYGDLSYESASDQVKIHRILLLFNVESVRLQEDMQRFPFYRFKSRKWSLEHIHAQNSEGLNTLEKCKLWLEHHLRSVRAVCADDSTLIGDMEKAIADPKLSLKDTFEPLYDRVVVALSPQGSDEYKHTIANLALLSVEDNAALNNATFDVKRNVIVELDQKGKYIPFCTRMVFLKYYTKSEDNQIHFWGESDRMAYIDKINEILNDYLDEKITIGNEEQ